MAEAQNPILVSELNENPLGNQAPLPFEGVGNGSTSDNEAEEIIVAVAGAEDEPSQEETNPPLVEVIAKKESELPVEGLIKRVEGRRMSTSTSGGSEFGSSVVSTDSAWMPVPEAICVYHQRGSCLRLNCRFFHGTAEQLKELRESGASHYRFDQNSKCVEVPAEGEDVSSQGPQSVEEQALGIRYADQDPADRRKGRKKPIVCLAYLSGTCRRPDCRFTHLPPNVRPLPSTACAYYAVGTCKRSTCRYFHGPEETLAKLKAAGATMYNPQTNEPYDKIPDFDEPPSIVGKRIDSGLNTPGSSGITPGSLGASATSPFQQSGHSGAAPPPYLSVQQPAAAPVLNAPVPAGQPQPQPQMVMMPPAPGQPQPQPQAQPGFTSHASAQPVPQIAYQHQPAQPQPQAMAMPPQQPQPAPGMPIPMAQPQTFMQTPQGLVPLMPGQQPPPGVPLVQMAPQPMMVPQMVPGQPMVVPQPGGVSPPGSQAPPAAQTPPQNQSALTPPQPPAAAPAAPSAPGQQPFVSHAGQTLFL